MREDLKEMSPILHRDFDSAEDSQAKYASDKRYRKLIKDFKRQLAKCHDCRLETSLKSIIQREILLAKYRLNANDAKFRGMSNAADEEIRQYIDTKMKSRDTV
ncbi:MAG: hypothetical protein EHM12_10015 [Dehalococcoidia bacterium]|nr:MAG: hypothetical protein EHM12_10015 [Dehalococcoidia bacterium]